MNDDILHSALIAAARYNNPDDEPAYDKAFYDGFLAGAEHYRNLPALRRLSGEELSTLTELIHGCKQMSNPLGTFDPRFYLCYVAQSMMTAFGITPEMVEDYDREEEA